VRVAFPIPETKPLPEIDLGLIPALEELGLTQIAMDDRSMIDYRGGEDDAWWTLNEYVWKKDLLHHYKVTRNGLIGSDYASNFHRHLRMDAFHQSQFIMR